MSPQSQSSTPSVSTSGGAAGSPAAAAIDPATLGNGRASTPETAVKLQAGPLAVDLIEGELRYFKAPSGGEAVRRIYAAVRDGSWNTIAPVRSRPLVSRQEEGGFEVTWHSEHVDGEVDFAWESRILGTADGVIRWEFDGVARRAFAKNRVGFCILHPLAACQGNPCGIEYLNGDTADRRFPDVIAPDQPVRGLHDFRKITYAVDPAWQVELEFEGDAFEMEDQRNWTDASFKTYSTPQRIPLPGRLREGQRVRQAVTVRLLPVAGSSAGGNAPGGTDTAPQGVTLRLADGPLVPFPKAGLGMPAHGGRMPETEAARLQALALDHLRVDVKLSQPDWREVLRHAASEAGRIGAALEIALHLTVAEEAAEAVEVAATAGTPVARWLVIEEGKPVVSPVLLKAVRPLLPDPAGAGTDIDFFPLNNNRPAGDSGDFIFCSIRPQAHAFDDATVIENLEGQTQVTDSARKIFAPLPFVASPVTLKRRWHKGAPRPAHELPPMVDLRQMSLLGAGWLTGSLRALAGAGAASVTWFETTGWRGVMETEAGAPLPREFPSVPGTVFPMYHVLRAAAAFRQAGGMLRAVEISDPLAVQAVVMERGREGAGDEGGAGKIQLWIIANVTGQGCRVTLPENARIRLLDPAAAIRAGGDPDRFLHQTAEVPALDGEGYYPLPAWSLVFVERTVPA